jgi:hypothetical protein
MCICENLEYYLIQTNRKIKTYYCKNCKLFLKINKENEREIINEPMEYFPKNLCLFDGTMLVEIISKYKYNYSTIENYECKKCNATYTINKNSLRRKLTSDNKTIYNYMPQTCSCYIYDKLKSNMDNEIINKTELIIECKECNKTLNFTIKKNTCLCEVDSKKLYNIYDIVIDKKTQYDVSYCKECKCIVYKKNIIALLATCDCDKEDLELEEKQCRDAHTRFYCEEHDERFKLSMLNGKRYLLD